MPATLAVVENTPPLSPARRSLAEAIEAVGESRRALEGAATPERRLAGTVARAETVEAELSTLRAEDDRLLAEWLTSGQGDRPQPSKATLACEKRVITARADGSAARRALPAVQEAVRLAAEQSKSTLERRDAAVVAAAVEAAKDFADSTFREAMAAAVTAQAKIEALRHELLALDGEWRDAGPASAKTGALIAEARASAVCERNHDAAKRLLSELAHDPSAELA